MFRATICFWIGLVLATCAPLALSAQHVGEAELENPAGEGVGHVALTRAANGVHLEARIDGIAAGDHAFHIHETGSCSPDFEAAGGHLNPSDDGHGFLDDDGLHPGDLPNIHVASSQRLELELFVEGISLDGEGEAATIFDDDGSAIVVHQGADDHRTNPAGDAGSRIACGVIR